MAKRINLDLNSEKSKELQILLKASGCSTMKEFFNNLLTFYKWALLKKQEGRDIGSFKNGVFYELEMPILGGIGELELMNKLDECKNESEDSTRGECVESVPA